MIRIGIIGTESTHALAFARFFDLPDESGSDDIRVIAIAGSKDGTCSNCTILQ